VNPTPHNSHNSSNQLHASQTCLDYLPDVVGTLTNGRLFIAEAGLEDEKREARQQAKAEGARKLARKQAVSRTIDGL
jgi:hypothetical protein